MVSILLEEGAPFDPAVAESLLGAVSDLIAITEVDEQGFSRLPLELQASATLIQNTLNYLFTGANNITLDEFLDQVGLIL